jgi:hypothetical protein
MLGAGALWVTELILAYDGKPAHVVSIMEPVAGEVSEKRSISTIRSPLAPRAHNGSSGASRHCDHGVIQRNDRTTCGDPR